MAGENGPRVPEGVQCSHCGGTGGRQDGGVLRCACGSLLARYVESGIELKCRRCKRTVIVPATAAQEEPNG